MNSDSAPRLPARRWRLQFRLRTLLILFTVACVLAGVVGVRWYRNHRMKLAETAIVAAGGRIVRQNSPHVTRVQLAGEKFDDARLAELAGHLAFLPELRQLDLVSTRVSDVGLMHLQGLAQVREIYVFENAATAEGVRRLQAALPRVVVKRERPDPIATALVMRPIYRHALVALRRSPDGRALAAGDGHGEVRLWRLDAQGLPRGEQPQRQFSAHAKWAFALAFDPQGRYLASGGGDHLIRLWGESDYALTAEFAGHQDDVHALVFSPDGRRLYSTGDDMTVRAWEVPSGRQIAELSGHSNTVPALAISPDGRWLASGSRDHTVRIWDAQRLAPAHTLAGHQDDVMSVAFDPQGKALVSAGYDGAVRLWDVETGRAQAAIAAHSDWIFAVAFAPDGNSIATAGRDSVVATWDFPTLTRRRSTREIALPSALAHLAGGAVLAVASAEGSVTFLDSESLAIREAISTRFDGLLGMAE